MKILIWMNMPSHHQAAFFEALIKLQLNLLVCYYSKVDVHRLSMGWENKELSPWEHYVDSIEMLEIVAPDWRDRIHIVPGIAETFPRQLVFKFIRENIKWVHWSEGFRLRWRSLITFPIHFVYSIVVINRYALGLLANGSLAYKQFLRWGVYPHKLAKLSYSIAPLENISDFGNTFRFLFLGTIDNNKSVDVLIKAFSKLPDNLSVELKIVGRVANDNPLSYYLKLILENNLVSKVKILPPVSVTEVSKVISSCDVLVLPSKHDGWGVVVSEAISLGKFVIVSNNVGAAETLVDNGVNGFVFNAGSIDNLSKTLLAAYHVAQQKERVSRALEKFKSVSPEENADRLKLILESFSFFCSRIS